MSLKPHALFWGMVSISITLHIAASVAPWPQAPATEEELVGDSAVGASTIESAIEIATIPAIALTQRPKPSADTATLSTATAESAVPLSSPQFPAITTPPEALAAAPLLPLEAPMQPVEEVEPLNSPPPPAQPAIEPAIEPDPVVTPEPPMQPVEEGTEDETETEQGPVIQLAADFPHLAGSQSGCYGLSNCHQTSGSYRHVVRQLTEQMKNQGYQLTEDDTIDGIGHRVFEVVMPSEPDSLYYLNVFSDGLDSAVYAITLNILSLDELKSLQA